MTFICLERWSFIFSVIMSHISNNIESKFRTIYINTNTHSARKELPVQIKIRHNNSSHDGIGILMLVNFK